jgi:DNA-binding Lrp family transcriptional regulator
MIELDAVDRKIIRALQADANLSTQSLAEKVGSSQSSCWRKVRSLEETGVLGKLTRSVDARAIGLSVNVMCNIRLKNHQPDTRADFQKFINGRDEVLESFAMSGDWDYLLRVVSDSVETYQNFLMRSLLVHPSVVTASSHFVLSVDKFTTALPV